MLTAPRRLKVNSRRNSDCAIALDRLDWSLWWTDGSADRIYLKVHVKDDPDERVFRVHCRREGGVRLRMEGGELYWLVDA